MYSVERKAISLAINCAKQDTTFKKYYKCIYHVGIDIMNPIILRIYKNKIRKENYLHFISHPKLITKDNLIVFEKFLKFTVKNFDIESDFMNFK